MSRHDVLEEFLSYACYAECEAHDCIVERMMADEIVRLREQLAAVELSRDLMKGYYDDAVTVGTECAEKMRRAERILAALREPSETVISKVWEEIIVQCTLQTHDPKSGKPLKDWICHEVTEKEVPLVIRAAVEAAEQEASA